MGPAAPFLVVTRAGEIGQNLPHQLSADGKEMRTILKVDVASIDQPHINLSGRCEVCPRAAPTQWRTQLAAPILNSTRPNTKVSPIVIGVSDADRALAFANIEKAANYYDVNLAETSWHDLCIHPHKNKRKAAAKGAASRENRARS